MKTKIEGLVPHRSPFLFIDEIISMDEKSICTRYLVNKDHDLFSQVFKGHFPGNPITPGVLLCEMVFQAGAAFMASNFSNEEETTTTTTTTTPVIVKISDARFKQVVNPGDELDIEVFFIEKVSNAFYMKGTVRKNDKLALRITFTCALIKEKQDKLNELSKPEG